MRKLIPIFLLLFANVILIGQTADGPIEGNVSFKTSQNIYVKFKTTASIAVGDTLFIKQSDQLIPVLVVNNLSSISCVCSPISSISLSISDVIVAKSKKVSSQSENAPVNDIKLIEPLITVQNDSASLIKPVEQKILQQQIYGRFSASSYTNFSNTVASNSQRMKYTFALNANNVGNSKLSAETYISFAHTLNEWEEINTNIYNGLKIYSLALNYQFNENYKVTIGRKINPKISNIGAIDGLQFDMKIKSFSLGVVAGSRPDYDDYSLNVKLFQYGAYVAHDYAAKKGSMQTSLAYIEQQNSGNIDRRFVYLQHYNSLLKNLYFFGSIEVNLYKKINEVQDNSPNVNNLYFLLRYKVMRQLSFSVSYSSRQNVIYYETYKDYVERLLETATLQGFLFQVNSTPVKNLSVGLKAGYRYRTTDPKPTENLYIYLTYSRIPVLNVSATLSATFLQTSYVNGSIYSFGLNRDFFNGKISTGLNYRYVNYNFYNFESSQPQNIGEVNITWRIMKKLFCSVYYEGTFEKTITFNRIYVNLTQRF